MAPDRWLILVLGNALLDKKPLLKSGMVWVGSGQYRPWFKATALPPALLGDRSAMSAASLADFFCLQQAHPMITSTETASVKATQQSSVTVTRHNFFLMWEVKIFFFLFFFHYFSFLLKTFLHSCEYVQEKRFAKPRPEFFAFWGQMSWEVGIADSRCL